MRPIIVKIVPLFLFFCAISVFAEERCFSKEEAAKVIEAIRVPSVANEAKEVRKELLKMVEARNRLNEKILDNLSKNQKLVPEFNKLGETHLLRVCQIIREKGWLGRNSLQDDGFRALISLINNNRAYRLQSELYPILVAAAKNNLLPKNDLATIFDSIRIGTGQPQIFGTQATIRNEIVYIQPLLNEEKVDEWRKEYDLPPLKSFINLLERQYQMPVLKLPLPARLQKAIAKSESQNAEVAALGIQNAEDEVLKIDTQLVNLNVRIFNQSQKTPDNLNLTKEDFAVYENGTEQELSFFSATEAPFDLVLLLDFSGSTVDKRDLIRQAAQRFVEVARPNDRIAVVIFTNEIEVVSNLTTERASLIEKIKKMDATGGSRIWGAVKFTYQNIIKKDSAGRRSAIVLMTDGEDNSIDMTFADLFEMVRRNDSTIFPVYLAIGDFRDDFGQKMVRKAQKSLTMLAEESGGTAYYARNAKDLRGIYEQIVTELGTVFSVGYEPKNENLDGSWRNLEVKIKTHPELTAKTRRGYYAK